MNARSGRAGRHSGNGLHDSSAQDPRAEIADLVRGEVARSPYVALLAAGGVGCLLARGLPMRLLPRLVDIGLRLAIVAVLPALTHAVSEAPAPEP